MTYTHDGSETISDNFDFDVNDATTNIGSANFAITVTPANDAPVGADNTVTFDEDTPYIFNVSDFGFTDPNDAVPNNLQNVIITSLPTNGTFELAAGASNPGLISTGQVINAADIPFLTFTPDLNDNGVNYADFTFQLQDDGGTVGTGVDISDTYTMQLDVTPVNDAPFDLTVSSLFLPEGIDTWNIGTLQGFDVDSTLFTYSIVSGDPSFSLTNGNILTSNGTKTFGVDPDTYSITLRVSDGALTYDETFTVTLLPEPIEGISQDPNVPFDALRNNDSGISTTSTLQQPRLEFYIRDFMEEIRNGEIFRYGNQGLIDSSLSLSDTPMKDVFYGNGVDEIIKRNVINRLQQLAADIADDTGVTITPEQLAEIFGLDVILMDMELAGELDETDNDQTIEDTSIFETNAIYKALVSLRNEDTTNDDDGKDITEGDKKGQRQYLHKQLDEAALYYQSKNSALLAALLKGE